MPPKPDYPSENTMHKRPSSLLSHALPPNITDPTHHVEVFAIQALDDLTGHLLEKHKFSVPPEFLDWIGHEATALTRQVVRRYVESDGLGTPLNPSRAEVTILRLVYETVTPMIVARFQALAGNCDARTELMALQA
jgi:hypothetical protein